MIFHFSAGTFGIIGQADEFKIAGQIPPGHGIKPVDVIRFVKLAPLHTNDSFHVKKFFGWFGRKTRFFYSSVHRSITARSAIF